MVSFTRSSPGRHWIEGIRRRVTETVALLRRGPQAPKAANLAVIAREPYSGSVRGTDLSSADAAGENETLDPPPASERRSRSLSSMLWGIDWAEHLPLEIVSGVHVVQSTYEASAPFIREHYRTIFEENAASPFATRLTGQKERYYRVAGDFFEFKDENETVGLLVGTPIDWSSYYIRTAAALPRYQGKKIIQRFFPKMFDILRNAGIERVEADTSPSNMATLHLLTRLRFNPTGTLLSDRFGATMHFTRFLDEASENVFLRQFCTGVGYQLRERVERATDEQRPEGSTP
jgi:hypothetical protein